MSKHESNFSEIFRVARLRYRAEECRAICTDFNNDECRRMLLTLALEYDRRADLLERGNGMVN